jgi:NitT/TauT family transport system permease protein
MLTRRRLTTFAAQLALAAFLLGSWYLLPKIGWIADHVTFLNPTYISSPGAVAQTVYDLLTDSNPAVPSILPYLRTTLFATLVGVVVGLALGMTAGLLASTYDRVAAVVWPFVVLANAVPRIALIPVIVLIVGPTTKATIFSAILIVFFISFFNALEAGRSVPDRLVQYVEIMGANSRQKLTQLRFPYVVAWIFAIVPSAVSFALVAVVTTELLTGAVGVGGLILRATATLDAELTFGVIAILSVVGLLLTSGAQFIRRRVVRWPVGG